uniref:LysR substrate-binding domain-containing protein n=1 Tax=Bosea sp. NBC_00436 TaxID=2969620 RepID=A0A9E8A1U4_9HYPH
MPISQAVQKKKALSREEAGSICPTRELFRERWCDEDGNVFTVDRVLDLAVNLRERGAASAQSILFEDLYVFARPNLIDLRKPTITLADVLQHKLLLPPRGHVVRELVEEAAGKQGLTIRLEAEVEGLPTLKSLIRDALAPGILGYGSIKSDFDDGRFQGAKIVKPGIQRELVLNEGANAHFPKVVAELRGIVTKAVRELSQ